MGIDLGSVLACNVSALDFVLSFSFTPYMITDAGEIWTFDLTAIDWFTVDITDLGTSVPVAVSVSITEDLWVVTDDGYVWQ